MDNIPTNKAEILAKPSKDMNVKKDLSKAKAKILKSSFIEDNKIEEIEIENDNTRSDSTRSV